MSTLVYQQITLQFSNAQPGQQVAVQVTANGVPVGFCSGAPLQSNTAFRVSSLSGAALPLTQLSLSSAQLAITTSASSSSGGGSLSFSVTAYLAADSTITSFYLRSTTDPGVMVTAQLSGAQAVVLSQTSVLFAWPKN